MVLPKKPFGAAFRKQKRDRERSDLDKEVAIKNWLLSKICCYSQSQI